MLGWAIIAAEWIIRLGMTPAVVRKRDAPSALAWLAFIYLIPWVGIFFYLMFGEVDLGKKRSARHDAASQALREHLDLRHHPEAINPPVRAAQRDLELLCRRVGGSPALGGNRVEPIGEIAVLVRHLVREIDAAEHSVHLLYYIYGVKGLAVGVAEALERAAARGVACRVLADGVGSKAMLAARGARLRRAGVHVSACLPVSVFRRALARVDLRNHRKLAVIDGRVAYVGSHNLIDADYGTPGAGPWIDFSVRVEGPAVPEFQAVFAEDWNAETGEMLTDDGLFPETGPVGETPVQVAPSGPSSGRAEAFRWLAVAALHEAQERVVITSPYLAIDESTLRALQLTAMRGVTVEMVLPERSNHRLAQAACRANYDALLRAGVRIHLHQSGLLHTKTLTVDDAFVLGGSGNFDMRSFLINFELNTILYGPDATGHALHLQERYIGESRELTLEEWSKRPGWQSTVDRLANLASPLL